jgi:hypothetical protein
MYPLHTVVLLGLFSFAIGGALVSCLWWQAAHFPMRRCPKCHGDSGEYKARGRNRRFEGHCVRCGNTGRVQRFGAGRYLRDKSQPARNSRAP